MSKSKSIILSVLKRSRNTTFVFGFFLFILICSFVYINNLNNFKDEARYWEVNLKESLLTHLMDSDYYSIQKKVALIEKTGLFKSVVIVDANKLPVYPEENQGKVVGFVPIKDKFKTVWGYYKVQHDYRKLVRESFYFLIGILVLIVIYFFVYDYFQRRVLRRTLNSIGDLVLSFDELNQVFDEYYKDETFELRFSDKDFDYSEINLISNSVKKLLSNLIEKNKKIVDLSHEQEELKKKEAFAQLASQISHDIRSPLESLKSITSDLNSLDYNTRRIVLTSIGRISGIANELLQKRKDRVAQKEVISLLLFIEDLCQTKLLEHQEAQINFSSDVKLADSFIVFNRTELYAVLSNLINNAVEAYDKGNVIVDLKLKREKDLLNLSIVDQGIGISEAAISKVFDKNFTTKERGSGLGLTYAFEKIKEYKGELAIRSKQREGTTLSITLPAQITPLWFVESIQVQDGQNVICLDDDLSFLQLYQEKFNKSHIKIQAFNEREIDQLPIDHNNIYFVDYDLAPNFKGLEFILNNSLTNCAYLVTSKYDDMDVKSACIEHGIKLLSKEVFNKIDIVINQQEIIRDYVLIDDDELVRKVWSMEASKVGKNLTCFNCIEGFLESKDKFSKDTIIFVDSNLENGVKGEIESEKILNNGFENIHLATGMSPDEINKPAWIKSIIGKKPLFL